MNRVLWGGALGALAMYFLDPHSGRRRRARTRDRLVHTGKALNQAGRVTVRDTAQRARGVVASTKRLFQRSGEVADDALEGRVRAALGRVVSHSHAIEVYAQKGHISLAGPVLAHEARSLVHCVRNVRGVRSVSDHLTLHATAEGISSLQGGLPRSGPRFELLQRNWSPAARLAAGCLGGGMVARSFHEQGLLGVLLGFGGSALLARAATNRDVGSLLGLGERGITVEKVINVNAAPGIVFGFWTDYQNFPRFMSNVREVQPLTERRSHWVVAGPAGVPVQWTAQVTRIVPDELIEWRGSGDSSVQHSGSVRFSDNGAGGTRVSVRLSYMPPAGAFGHAVAALFGADPKSEMDADLLRMKSMIETGRAAHDAARRIPSES
jgi:uncharacterized membrane protein